LPCKRGNQASTPRIWSLWCFDVTENLYAHHNLFSHMM
jgi:hypothetical protein